MTARIGRIVVMLAVALLMASRGSAQISQGRIAGTVTDAQGAVLPGVTVTATSPSLIGARTAVTAGRRQLPVSRRMPSGTYKLTFELVGLQEGRARQHRGGHRPDDLRSTRSCRWAALTESVTVTGDSPLVDTSTTKIGTSLKGDALTAVPNSTDVWGALVGSARRAHAGLRRRRQPQEPAVGL